MQKPKARVIIIVSIVGLVFFVDQLTKYLVKQSMELYKPIEILGRFFMLRYIENSGMAFGIQLGNKVLFTALSVAAIILVLFYLIHLRNERMILQVAIALILGGALGNMFDRIVYGRVVDFLDFEFFDIYIPEFNLLFITVPEYGLTRWPIFNIADTAVTIGMLIITWMLLFTKNKGIAKPNSKIENKQV